MSITSDNDRLQFDAEVVQEGAYVEHGHFPVAAFLETTCVMHPNNYLSRELLNTKGVVFGLDGLRRLKTREIESKPVGYTNDEFIQSYSKLVLKQIEKKADIEYPAETTLIVQCSLNTIYMPEEWEALIAEVRSGQAEHQFREIFLYDTTSEYSCSLSG